MKTALALVCMLAALATCTFKPEPRDHTMACDKDTAACPDGYTCDDSTGTCAKGCSDDSGCASGFHCDTNTNRCRAACSGMSCGTDLGFACGTCSGSSAYCDTSVNQCKLACSAMNCGTDHDVACGTCATNNYCDTATNRCKAVCSGMTCGTDHGVACGTCSGSNSYCETGANQCKIACSGMKCGTDHGFACGTCTGNDYCDTTAHDCQAACNGIVCGVDHDVKCGTCNLDCSAYSSAVVKDILPGRLGATWSDVRTALGFDGAPFTAAVVADESPQRYAYVWKLIDRSFPATISACAGGQSYSIWFFDRQQNLVTSEIRLIGDCAARAQVVAAAQTRYGLSGPLPATPDTNRASCGGIVTSIWTSPYGDSTCATIRFALSP